MTSIPGRKVLDRKISVGASKRTAPRAHRGRLHLPRQGGDATQLALPNGQFSKANNCPERTVLLLVPNRVGQFTQSLIQRLDLNIALGQHHLSYEGRLSVHVLILSAPHCEVNEIGETNELEGAQ